MRMLRDGAYGSDQAGLVWAYLFTPGHSSSLVTSEEALRLLQGLHETDAFLWLHFGLSNTASERWLRSHLQLPDTFYDSLRESPSTRVEATSDSLVAVVHDLQFFGEETGVAATVTLSVDSRLMVSARTTQLRAIDRL